MSKEKNLKKLVFGEKALSIINALSLFFTYIVIGIIMYVDNNFFGSVTKAIEIAFVALGLLGVITEVRKLNFNYSIKGLDNIVISLFLLALLYLGKVYVKTEGCLEIIVFIYQLLLFFLLLITVFLFFRGINMIVYSISLKTKEKGLGEVITSIIVMFAQIISLFVLGMLIFGMVFK